MDMEWWKSFFEVGGVALLFLTFAFGAGFMLTSKKVNERQSERLRKFDADMTVAKSDLAKQQERAAKAEATVALAEQHSAEANAKAEAFRLDIANANEASARAQADAADAKTEMAKQQTRAATAELALLELQQRLAHRRINPDDHKKLVAALLPFRGSVVNLTKLGEGEAAQFADDLISVFHEAGWSVQENFVGMISPPRYGLECRVNESSEGGKALAGVLRKLPTADVRTANPPPPAVAVIFVGLKPPA
jgi:hypothetical protein